MNVNFPELIVIFCVALLVLGPERLPDVARKLGRLFGQFKNAMNPNLTNANTRTPETMPRSPRQSELVDAALSNPGRKE